MLLILIVTRVSIGYSAEKERVQVKYIGPHVKKKKFWGNIFPDYYLLYLLQGATIFGIEK